MRNLFITLITAALFVSCSTDDPNQGSFVTLLGNDTLAVEQFVKTDSSITAQVILRSPEVQISTYILHFDELGGIESMVQTDHSPVNGFQEDGATVRNITKVGDSLSVRVLRDEEYITYRAPFEEGLLPFIDMVHWPYELAFNKAAEADQDTIIQPLLSGNRIMDFTIAQIEGDSMTVRHPFRGVMGVRVNSDGDIQHLDAGLTTRKLKVHRTGQLDMNALANRFGNDPVGELSGAVSAEYSFKGANFRVDFGSPKKRGRDLFGNIVPWGERWRTGANRATHFYTSEDLMFGDLEVPAGEYTLFTIPQPDGGTLIINKQTGQNGRSYDESRDLGRVPMEISTTVETIEAFTISVEETEEGGELNLAWGNTVFKADFTIQ
ncbi:MAG: DUF2911 domain-containing protein [Gracilimonas sp.]|uniref:DUF2911 domain-containing protein n=1 Tax=Gracilimonas sp. TaxID=1974203 RepID=UPI001B1FA395|nr:DUF2911 domain-containing protein [Gracilimonas sp.]MBO6585005.1 DUF2911 domain-containing protein [Gracilimonas sp.]MBO6615724.1 DUF2911 domain-containing protein [Gracilimonas sp.]